MLRSRALREGSVGLMIIGGSALFIALAFWLRNISIGQTSYDIFVEFEDVAGLKEGTPVNFRGVEVGSVRRVDVSNELATARVEITRLDLKIPIDSFVSAQSAALIGDTSLDIDPFGPLSDAESLAGPLDEDCDRNIILCSESRIRGEKVATLSDLIIAMDQLASLLGDADLVTNLQGIASNAAQATRGIGTLTDDLSQLSQSAQREVGTLSTTLRSAGRAADSAQVAAVSIDQAAVQLGGVAGKASVLADDTSGLINQASGLADETSVLVTQATELIAENRVAIARTLDEIALASNTARTTLLELKPILADVRDSNIVADLEQLTRNARVLTNNLQGASELLANPQNILLLQQTLDSARVTFTNAQKLTSDLDEVTGDPQFRSNVLRLINGLSGLISSTQQLEQRVALQQSLSPQPLAPRQAQRLAQLNQQLDQASLALVKQLALVAQAAQAPSHERTTASPALTETEALVDN